MWRCLRPKIADKTKPASQGGNPRLASDNQLRFYMKQQHNKRLSQKDIVRGLPISLSMSIDDALIHMASGNIERSRVILEQALIYADTVHPGVAEHVGLDNVRNGEGMGLDAPKDGVDL